MSNPQPETAMVPFHGHMLLTIKDGDTVRVAMKPICEAIGLQWEAQLKRIKRDDVLGTCMSIMDIQVPGDNQRRDVVTLPLDFINGWLFGVDISRTKPEIRERLIEYKRECFGALAAYWQQGVATNPRARAATIPQLLATQREIRKLMQELKRETLPATRRTLHAQLMQACRLIAIPAPALDEIGHDAIPDHESPLLEEFWEVVDNLLAEGKALNHARDPSLLALNLPQVRQAAAEARYALADPGLLRRLLRASLEPRFVAAKAVNSAIEARTVKCWIFDRLPVA